MTRSFSALGRETFATSVEWADEWPVIAPVEVTDDGDAPTFVDDFDGAGLGPEWIAIRRTPASITTLANGTLTLQGQGRSMAHPAPAFVGRRQSRLDARITTRVNGRDGVGGLTIRYDEQNHYDLELDGDEIVARACVATIRAEQRHRVPAGPIVLFAEMVPPPPGLEHGATCDNIGLGFETAGGERVVVASYDGRFLAAETTCSFTGRVAGLYCDRGSMSFDYYAEEAFA